MRRPLTRLRLLLTFPLRRLVWVYLEIPVQKIGTVVQLFLPVLLLFTFLFCFSCRVTYVSRYPVLQRPYVQKVLTLIKSGVTR